MKDTEAIDRFLSESVRSILRSMTAPQWPEELGESVPGAIRRLEFHGIASFLAHSAATLDGWPPELAEALKTEARLQAVWEADHAKATALLIERLHQAEIPSLVMKGTALAYSVYSEPGMRRRGDTDLLVETSNRDLVRQVLRQSGFQPSTDRRFLQEAWVLQSQAGFAHQIDLHWATSSSMAVAKEISCNHPRDRAIDLPALSPNARAAGPLDSFIQICINRNGHEAFGYLVEGEKIHDGNRLIWALDLHNLAAGFSDHDWRTLIAIADDWSATKPVLSAIDFAKSAVGLQISAETRQALEMGQGSFDRISSYYGAPALERLSQDLHAAQNWHSKLSIVSEHILPGRHFMQSRYPDHGHWPLFALQIRRLLDGTFKMLLGRRL
ncbi:nucleotidyltransferase family protein [Erythrobacter sp. F6033]|uniref:nucleotidyltransferase family protein n=1 Tax=Erythrobacter sp. F6033 TaxID=2926401 RepID=UPI001FF0FDA2|nr:nucleotidyltransferase family protein [Erythrobacter sp. F6033]MCK0127183.1 nucleotidyltransferase family protein [Erythrobacter sp. F6033]